MIGAREAALLALNDIFYNGKYSNLAVKETLAKCRGMQSNEKALFTNLVYGVVSRHYTLEFVLSKFSSVKVKKLARYLRLILELGIYQIMFTDKIPDSAAVNESVKLAKKYCRKGSDRFINGVLRAVSRACKDIEYPQNINENLSVRYSYSPEMTDAFICLFGNGRAESIMRAMNEPPSLYLRANLLKIKPDEFCKKLSELDIKSHLLPDGMICAKGFDVGKNELYLSGMFSVQDRGAYNAAIVLDPQENETIIDMCAAPGGKTTHIAELMGDSGKIYACDIYEHKLKLIDDSVKRLGIQSVKTVLSDSTQPNADFFGVADRVLCDVPCSGWGIIRRKPDIKLSHTNLNELYQIQLSILKNASLYVKKDGCIVYSTCTFNRRENEDIINNFLKENNNFEKVYEKTFYPDVDDTDGFFICRLNRK